MTIKQQGGVFGRNPSFNNVDATDLTVTDTLNVNNGLLYTDTANQRVGIGTKSPTFELHLARNGAGIFVQSTNSSEAEVRLDNTIRSWTQYVDGSGNYNFRDRTGAKTVLQFTTAGNLAVANGNGIDFSATSGTGTSELFDDYEEGSFSADTGGLTTNYTFTSKFGRYTKVGDMVTVWFRYAWTTTNTGSGDTVFNALPFSAAEDGYVHITECTGNIAADQIHGRIASGTSNVKIYGRNNGSATQVGPAQRTIWGSSNVLAGVAVYKA